jgi:hypothetical protein
MKRPTIALAFLGLLSAPAMAEGPPLTIAPGLVEGEPEVSIRDYKGHKAWSIVWYRDEQGRALRIGLIEGLKLPYRERPREMLKFMHDEGSDDEADLRRDSDGRAEPMWNLDLFWLVASERAVMKPDPDKPETVKDGKLHRGKTRRNCAVFTAHPAGREATLIGSYCRELPPDAQIDEATARAWLQALDLKLGE